MIKQATIHPIKEGEVVMFANIDGKIFSKSFNFRKLDYKKGFEALKCGFSVRLQKVEIVKEAEDIVNG